MEPSRVCTRCGERKPWSEFYAKVKWPDGTTRQPQSRCKRCFAEIHAQRKRDNPEWWARNERKRARNRTPEQRAEKRVYNREYARQRYAIPPERFRIKGDEPVSGLVPVPDALRDRVREQGYGAVAAAAGWFQDDGRPDDRRVRNTMEATHSQHRKLTQIIQALGLDPVDIGV